MNLTYSQEDIAFRQEVRDFIRAAVPEAIARRTREGVHPTKEDLQTWNGILNEKGWAAAHWPKEFGGSGWTPAQVHIFEEECAAADAPFLSFFGLRLLGPLLYTFGTPEQQERYLEDIRSGAVFWCQGFSEPSAGSDLASVKTTAVRDGDHYIVNGQKIWTTEAHYADKMFCLARTNPDVAPQKGGLSILMFDMQEPQVTVRPIITLDGGHSVNEVFLDNVCVPASELLGHEGQGWDQAKFLLANERVTNAHVPQCKRSLERIRAMASDPDAPGGPMMERPDFRARLAQLEIDVAGLEWMVLRELFTDRHIRNAALPSGLKILGSEIQQRLADLAVEAAGPRAMVALPHSGFGSNAVPGDIPPELNGVAARQLFTRAATIYAGSNEIQRGIIARQIFGN